MLSRVERQSRTVEKFFRPNIASDMANFDDVYNLLTSHDYKMVLKLYSLAFHIFWTIFISRLRSSVVVPCLSQVSLSFCSRVINVGFVFSYYLSRLFILQCHCLMHLRHPVPLSLLWRLLYFSVIQYCLFDSLGNRTPPHSFETILIFPRSQLPHKVFNVTPGKLLPFLHHEILTFQIQFLICLIEVTRPP